MNLDKIAEAMTRVCWQGHLTFNDYRRMAQAAIDALGVTEEKRLDPEGWSFPETGVQQRLVSPWVVVEQPEEQQ